MLKGNSRMPQSESFMGKVLNYACESSFNYHLKVFEYSKEYRLSEFICAVYHIKLRICKRILSEYIISLDYDTNSYTLLSGHVDDVCEHLCVEYIRKVSKNSNLNLISLNKKIGEALFYDFNTHDYYTCSFKTYR